MKSNKQTFQHQLLESLQERGSSTLIKRCVELASEKGTSGWLTVQPIAEHGFHLSKGDFRDDLCLRYHWPLPNVPSPCECGQPFSIDHSMICRKGGFPTLRHNEVRDITADLLKEVCHNVDIEPALQPLSGETFRYATAKVESESRVDISARKVWRTGERAFLV